MKMRPTLLAATAALFLLAACGSSPANANASVDTERDPACATCPPDCCAEKAATSKSQAAVDVAPAKAQGECCGAASCCAPAATPKAAGSN